MLLLNMLLSYLYDRVNMLVRQMVEDLFSVPPGRNQLGGFQNLQLMGNRRRRHAQGFGDFSYTVLIVIKDKQNTYPGRVSEYLKQLRKIRHFIFVRKIAFFAHFSLPFFAAYRFSLLFTKAGRHILAQIPQGRGQQLSCPPSMPEQSQTVPALPDPDTGNTSIATLSFFAKTLFRPHSRFFSPFLFLLPEGAPAVRYFTKIQFPFFCFSVIFDTPYPHAL